VEWKAGVRDLPQVPGLTKGLLGVGQMLEPEAMGWLQREGIPVPTFRFVSDRATVVEACREIGYPVVMKVVSPRILHKSEYGGVALDINGDERARDAFDRMQHAAADKDFRGVVIYPMIVDAHEMLVGLSRDPQFGPVVACGLGGIYTEILRDISLRVAPVDHREAEAMLRELVSFPVLEGTRGRQRGDVDALADLLVTLSRLAFHYPEVAEVDLNPVFVLGDGVLVGDVRVIRV
jgi:acyl-CoA synthetase (NDP forming)